MKYKKNKLLFTLFILICFVSIGFAILSANFQINGLANVTNSKWKLYFDNIKVSAGSVTPLTDGEAKIDETDKTLVTFNVSLKKPGDFYEFTVDVVNEGSIDAMIESLVNKTPLTENEKKFLNFDVTYSNGVIMKEKDTLNHDTTQTIRVRLSFMRDIENSDLESIPNEGLTKSIQYEINYLQADETATTVDDPSFSSLNWRTISSLLKTNPETFHVGDEKEIDMGTLGTHYLRIANLQSPVECENNSNYSQTACGFVVEFKDIISELEMTSTASTKGGYPATKVYQYLKNDVYKSLPNDLKEVMINTRVVSSYGNEDNDDFITYDKLYLLSTAEVYRLTDENSFYYDSTKTLTRQLDYYANRNVTPESYEDAIKGDKYWWLRSASNYHNHVFYEIGTNGFWYYGDSSSWAHGISPAFRIA